MRSCSGHGKDVLVLAPLRAAVVAGKTEDAIKLLPGVHSAYDKAVKVGAITRPTANRKKSRLAISIKAVQPVAKKK